MGQGGNSHTLFLYTSFGRSSCPSLLHLRPFSGPLQPLSYPKGIYPRSKSLAEMETPLEKALTTMVTTFHKYSGREGSKLTLSRRELKELIKKELCLGEKLQESGIDELMKSLDKNSDQEIDFKEYSVFLTTLCMAYNDFFLEENK
ncbi:protein S100-A5 isoform X1 [Sarcophilus harrisii]|uniref:Protein S100 n=2 Tax=Sarcophilus harrisii TaxID=9305 RepID=G3W581_SARHA|nr:protein S100-A5 isoform X1 [Sarcophilus harrisii]